MKPLVFLVLFLAACNPYVATTPRAVSPTSTAQATVTPTKAIGTPTPKAATAKVIASQSLHVRQGPSEKSPLVSVDSYLYHGDIVTIQNCAAGWAQIEWQGGTAWVNAKFLSKNHCQTNKE